MKQYYTYILCEHAHGYLYVGVTSNLIQRVYQHREKLVEGYTKRKNISRLVYFEIYDHVEHAIKREETLKKWKREWKFNLIEKDNPYWEDLYLSLP
jgi:putative endonuclease